MEANLLGPDLVCTVPGICLNHPYADRLAGPVQTLEVRDGEFDHENRRVFDGLHDHHFLGLVKRTHISHAAGGAHKETQAAALWEHAIVELLMTSRADDFPGPWWRVATVGARPDRMTRLRSGG